MSDGSASYPAFIMPVYCRYSHQIRYLKEAINGIRQQTDSSWQLIIIDDGSPCKNEVIMCLTTFLRDILNKVTFVFMGQNRGPGFCRNIGTKIAASNNADFVLYNDADDISHPERLERTRSIFISKNQMDLVYSTFKVIDEDSQFVSHEDIPKAITTILDSHKNPPQGSYAWRDIGTRTGYVNLTSATSVRTSLALNYPFPEERYSEDSHTWYRMFAASRDNCFDSSFPSTYRIARLSKCGTASRDLLLEMGIDYCEEKRRIDTAGFMEAIEIAFAKGLIPHHDKQKLLDKFKVQLTNEIRNENSN